MNIKKLSVGILLLIGMKSNAQEFNARIDLPFFDYPGNIDLPYNYPTMNQALAWSNDLYEFAYLGIDEAGDLIFRPEKDPTIIKKAGNILFKYGVGFAFAKYGSELPVPLGIWAHEEFHRSVLGTRNLGLKNGNWLFSRWDGTVYGATDENLTQLKSEDLSNLLYSYVAGVQYEILSNERITLDDFYHKRSFSKAPLVLYNAYYVWNYFRFSASSASDSAKILAPPHEDINPEGRDYTGADLNAWVYDMFKPGIPFTNRSPFPGGNGVNRRIGYSDLSPEEKDYLNEQKTLSLLNFINPAIFLLERFRLSESFSFNFFAQYVPSHFGNSIGFYLPVKIKNTGYLLNLHRYSNQFAEGYGFGAGIFNMKLAEKIYSDLRINFWNQPETFSEDSMIKGGSIGIKTNLFISDHVSVYVYLGGKTKGWLMENPYLDENLTVRTGFSFEILKNN